MLQPIRRHALPFILFALIIIVWLSFAETTPGSLPLPLARRARQHPISTLIAQAEQRHAQQQTNSSLTLRAAFNAYRAAHDGRLPPRGWDKWYKASRERNVCNLDRFTEMKKSLQLFRALEPREVRERQRLLDERGIAGMVAVRDGRVLEYNRMVGMGVSKGRGGHESCVFRRGFVVLLNALAQDWHEELPDVEFIINGLDEPRVATDHALQIELEQLSAKGRKRPFTDPNDAVFRGIFDDDGVDVLPYEIIRRTCPPNSLARLATVPKAIGSNPVIHHKHTAAFTASEAEGRFIIDHDTERSSWCDQPDLMELHAIFSKPLNLHYTHDIFPIFSNSKLPGFSDILIPTWYYWGPFNEMLPYRADKDPEWDGKDNNLFWRGSNTGGWSVGANWLGWMRSRIVSKLNRPASWGHSDSIILADSADHIISATFPSVALNEALTDIAFSSVDDHGEPDSLHLQRQEPSFRWTGRVPFARNYKSKAIADFDGTAYSGRFLTLMKSRSAVFKSRLYIEAIEETLIPWFHYVPLSLRFSEIYSLVGYFFGVQVVVDKVVEAGGKVGRRERRAAKEAPDHLDALKTMAERGTRWAQDCGKHDDHISYAYLLALEWARILSDDRDEMNFTL